MIKERKIVDKENPNYYLDKDQMRDALRVYRDMCLVAESQGKEIPVVPNYICECFMNISKGLAMKYNFRDYSFVRDMEMDGVMDCLYKIRKFDPDMISPRTGTLVSPLAFFTQTCFWAFVGRIKKEGLQTAIKWSLILDANLESYTSDDDEEFNMNLSEFIKALGPHKDISAPKAEKKVSDKKSVLSDFMDEA